MKPKFNKKYKGIKCRVYLVRENAKDEVIEVNDPIKIYELVKDELVSSDRERFLSVMITSKNHLIGVETVSVGSISSAIIKPRDVFKSAILGNAVSIVLCHNHPSGDLTPSDSDIEITKHLIEAGELLGIKVLDHLIVSNQGYKSLRDYCKFPD
jgi:DNA repair protein RadC